jgi:hypothetical protein
MADIKKVMQPRAPRINPEAERQRRSPGYQDAAERISEFIRSYYQIQGYSPSINEMEIELSFSRSGLYYRLVQMRDLGDLLFEEGVARSFRLPGQRTTFEKKVE